MDVTGRRAGTRASTRWARSLRRWFSLLDVTDLHVHRHPSRYGVDVERRAAQVHAARAGVTPVAPESGFEELLEEWGRSA